MIKDIGKKVSAEDAAKPIRVGNKSDIKHIYVATPVHDQVSIHFTESVLDFQKYCFKNKLKVGKINVEENRTTASEFGIRGIPTLLLFQHGEMLADHVGAPSLEGLIEFIEKNITKEDSN